MARNPYAGMRGDADPYTNGNPYAASSTAPVPGTDDYDPYGERYGTPPITSASASRDRRAARAGGYGGFYENSNGSSSSALGVQPAPPQAQMLEGYGRGRGEEPPPMRSSRRPAGLEPVRTYMEEADSSEGSRGPEYRRGVERQYQNGGIRNDSASSRNRSNGRGGGDGTRQIEG